MADVSIRELIEQHTECVPWSGCWIWMRSTLGNGYGQYFPQRLKPEGVHRASYREYRGPIPKGMHVCHKCDTPACCNPAHLFLGTPKDNSQDSIKKGRWNPGRTGGPRKVTDEQRHEIVEARRRGLLQREIGEMFGITQVRVSQILRRMEAT